MSCGIGPNLPGIIGGGSSCSVYGFLTRQHRNSQKKSNSCPQTNEQLLKFVDVNKIVNTIIGKRLEML